MGYKLKRTARTITLPGWWRVDPGFDTHSPQYLAEQERAARELTPTLPALPEGQEYRFDFEAHLYPEGARTKVLARIMERVTIPDTPDWAM